MNSKQKKPHWGATPAQQKNPQTAHSVSSYDDRKASWRVGRIQMVDPYGWHDVSSVDLGRIKARLSELEKLTWKDIFVRDARYNHQIEVNKLKCSEARKWMKQHMPDQPYLWTLRLTGAERIWGIFSEGAYLVIFWDPQHLIWEIPKK